MDREIWFYRICWGNYIPCHWKGLVLLVGFIVGILATTFGGHALLDALGYEDAAWAAFPVFFFTGFIPLMVIAHRHS